MRVRWRTPPSGSVQPQSRRGVVGGCDPGRASPGALVVDDVEERVGDRAVMAKTRQTEVGLRAVVSAADGLVPARPNIEAVKQRLSTGGPEVKELRSVESPARPL